MRELIPLLFLGAFVAVPIALVVAFVQLRAKARRAAQEGPWSALAQQLGGRFEGGRIFVDRGAYQLTLDTKLVSVMQAASTPYYPDGGTFTEARVAFDPRGTTAILPSPDAVPLKLELHELSRIPALATLAELTRLPAGTRVFLGAKDARVVMHGAIVDASVIGAAMRSLDTLAQGVSASGPLAQIA
ncbi:hypothetical protein [Sandaracinus amylolyticus]|uniref:Uncharacterized protein n=1 Tax=Sandaracinus amylolyticus TaxID=927083 RepID=A0A0F6YJP2_9BACT|nr:hypothetical protein [Sandaracinus amylolyticus]AKF07528.1 hypothetical protein DB32_004677 [Sandaracinus amylolyticus]